MARTASKVSNSIFFTSLIIGMVVIFLSLFAPLFISDESVKKAFADYVYNRSGLRAEIAGDVSLSLFPVLKVRLKEVNLTPPGDDLVKRPPLTVREVVTEISYGDLLAGGSPDRVSLSAPTFYFRRIDLENENWEGFLEAALSGASSSRDISAEEMSELWTTLFYLCKNSGDTDIDNWKQSAVAALKANPAESGISSGIIYVTGAVCPDAAKRDYVRSNWELFAQRFAASRGAAGGGAPFSLPALLTSLAGEIEIDSATLLYDAFGESYRQDLINAALEYDNGFRVYGDVRGVRYPISYDIAIDDLQPGGKVKASFVSENILDVAATGELRDGEEGMFAELAVTGAALNPSELHSLFGGGGTWLEKIGYKEKIDGVFSLRVHKNGFEVTEGTLKAPVIDTAIRGGLRYTGSYDSDFDTSVVARVKHIDIDALIAKEAPEENNPFAVYESGSLLRIPQLKLNLPKLFVIHADIEAEKIIYKQKDVTSLVLEADIYSGRASLHRFTFDMPGDSRFNMNGYVEHNGVRPLFLGQISASGGKLRDAAALFAEDLVLKTPEAMLNDFSLKAAVRMTPVSMTVEDALLTFDNTSLRGDMTMDYIDTTSAANITVIADRLDADMYGFTDRILNYLHTFRDSPYADSSVTEATIRNIGTQVRLTLQAEDLRFNRHNIRHAEAIISYGPGKFNIDKLALEDNEKVDARKTDINAYMHLAVPEQGEPSMKIFWKSGHLNTDMFLPAGHKPSARAGRITEGATLPYLIFDRFDGDITFAVDNLYVKGEKLASNLLIDGEATDTIIRLNEARALLFGGARFLSKVKMSLGDILSVGASFTVMRMPMERLTAMFPDIFRKKLEGNLSMQGKIQTAGADFRQMARKADLQGKFAIDKLRVDGINLKRIFAAAVNTISVVDMKREIQRGLSEGSTLFSSAKGTVSTIKTGDPYQWQFKDVVLRTPYSRSFFAANFNFADRVYRSLFRFLFRPDKEKTLALNFSGLLDASGNLSVDINDEQLVEYVTSKTEGIE